MTYIWISLVSHYMIHEVGAGVTITTDSHTLVNTVCRPRYNIIQLVGHTTGTRYVCDAGNYERMISDEAVTRQIYYNEQVKMDNGYLLARSVQF